MHLRRSIARFQVWQLRGRSLSPFDSGQLNECRCLNCGTIFRGEYCPHCGQPANTTRLSLKRIIDDGLQVIGDLDNRLLRTLVELCLRPGHMIRDYVISGKRQPYQKPLSLLFLLATAYLVIYTLMGGEPTVLGYDPKVNDTDTTFSAEDQKAIFDAIGSWIAKLELFYDNRAWQAIGSILVCLIPNKLIYRKTKIGRTMNYTEHFYLLCYMQCLGIFLAIFKIPYYLLIGEEITNTHIDSTVGFILYVWITHQFFRIGWKQSLLCYLKSMFLSIFLLVMVIVILVLIVILVSSL